MTGKEKCDLLKKMRAEIAKENGIKGFEYKECQFGDDCPGYCPACDDEAEALRVLLKQKGVEVGKDQNEALQPMCIDNNLVLMGKIARPKTRLRGKVIDRKFLDENGKRKDARDQKLGGMKKNDFSGTIKDESNKKPRGIIGIFKKKK